MKWRLGISIGFLLVLMYVSMFHMYHEWFGLPIPGFVMAAFHGNENAMTLRSDTVFIIAAHSLHEPEIFQCRL